MGYGSNKAPGFLQDTECSYESGEDTPEWNGLVELGANGRLRAQKNFLCTQVAEGSMGRHE